MDFCWTQPNPGVRSQFFERCLFYGMVFSLVSLPEFHQVQTIIFLRRKKKKQALAITQINSIIVLSLKSWLNVGF